MLQPALEPPLKKAKVQLQLGLGSFFASVPTKTVEPWQLQPSAKGRPSPLKDKAQQVAEAWQSKCLAAESQLKKMKSEESLSAGRSPGPSPSQPKRSPQHLLNPGGRPPKEAFELRGVRGSANTNSKRTADAPRKNEFGASVKLAVCLELEEAKAKYQFDTEALLYASMGLKMGYKPDRLV